MDLRQFTRSPISSVLASFLCGGRNADLFFPKWPNPHSSNSRRINRPLDYPKRTYATHASIWSVLEILGATSLENIAGLDTWHVQGFVNSLAIYELPTIYHTICVLRRVLGHLYAQGIITTDLSTVVPKLRYCKKAKIPSTYSKDEIERMVNSMDRGNERQKGLRADPSCRPAGPSGIGYCKPDILQLQVG